MNTEPPEHGHSRPEPHRIPELDLGTEGPVALYDALPEAAGRLLAIGRRTYTAVGLALADPVSRMWLRRSDSPYAGDVAAIASRMGRPGVWTLNLSYEWGCTTGVGSAPGGGMRLLRVLDWPLPGLGREVVVADTVAAAGRYRNVTWPGAVGVLTALCPGRFALAINQAPLQRRGPILPIDWTLDRIAVYRSTAMPPAHLARLVCETAPDYETAREILLQSPICIPAIFTLAGTRPGQGCVIEHRGRDAIATDGPGAIANQWVATAQAARPRGEANGERMAAMAEEIAEPNGMSGDFSWVASPILNERTRLAVIANPLTGHLAVRGYEPGAGPLPAVTCATV